jgi:S-ribosylhomocysteine lyase
MIKSFTIDHETMYAPNIRVADIYEYNGVQVIKYDIRLVTPNTTYIDDKTMHSMEHLMATAFKEVFKDEMIDLSPMGCKTGFYFTKFKTEESDKTIKEAIRKSATAEIPVPTAKNCGSYLLHNIEGAREFLRKVANQLDSSSN